MKGVAPFVIGAIIIVSLLGVYILGNWLTPGGMKGIRNPLEIVWDALTHLPYNDLIDYTVAGTMGLVLFTSKWVATPLIEWIMSVLLGRAVQVPELIGSAMVVILVVIYVWKSWSNLWQTVNDNLMRVMLVLIGVFAIGITLLYLGLI